jgi:sodium pump decarboxylase gamma subunit
MANFSDTLGYTFIVTLFGMSIVFIVLIALQYILHSMKLIFQRDNKAGEQVIQVPAAKPVEAAVAKENSVVTAEDDGELVAVITAAVMNCLGGRSNIVVRSIRRTDDLTPEWGKTSRMEQMGNRL